MTENYNPSHSWLVYNCGEYSENRHHPEKEVIGFCLENNRYEEEARRP
jgi:hypothetical protein